MTTTSERVVADINLAIESVRSAEEQALDAVRKFVDVVNSVLPDVADNGPRRKIIDAAVGMTHQLVGVSTELAQDIVEAASDPWAVPKYRVRSPN